MDITIVINAILLKWKRQIMINIRILSVGNVGKAFLEKWSFASKKLSLNEKMALAEMEYQLFVKMTKTELIKDQPIRN